MLGPVVNMDFSIFPRARKEFENLVGFLQAVPVGRGQAVASGGEGAVGDLKLWVLWVWGIGVFFGSWGSLARGVPFFRVLGAAEGAFAAEQVVVVLSESVGFVAHVLEQSQCERIAAQADGFFLAWEKDLFVLFGQGDKDRGSQIAVAKGG
jgi:hypothetical protein